MPNDEKAYGNRWRVIERIGNGGQGVVYKVADVKGLPTRHALETTLKDGLRRAHDQMINVHPDAHSFDELMEAIRAVVDVPKAPLAAVKELLPFEDSVAANEKAALARMKNELATLMSVSHPALLKVFDADLDHRWFAMEYFSNGAISSQPTRFKGQVLEALRAFRPVVEAVSELHRKKIVHRDIKPENVFVAADGHLVLGDCGLALKLEHQDRLTLSFENVGTRDYQPPWTYGMRVEDVKPNFDVFSLAKLLWAMVSGKPRFPLWYFDRKPHDLREQFPDDENIHFVQRIMKKCVVEHDGEVAFLDAGAFLQEVDDTIRAVTAGALVPTASPRKMRCRFCGIGFYEAADEFDVVGNPQSNAPRHHYCCDHCGHLEFFVYRRNQTPAAWKG